VDHDDQVVVWCQQNDEGDLLEKIIPGALQVKGGQSDKVREERFVDFTYGKLRVLITKPRIGAWGLNWQHIGHHVTFPSHSFEQFYQAIRRSLRFGRKDPVRCDIVTTEAESGVMDNLLIKQNRADMMFENIIREMKNAYAKKNLCETTKKVEVPEWIM